ncbi:MAG TPA: hypothetical protein VN812_17435, partial [Candidatus Acidoferrales bacterium]|nr:hypothetical protein [Candidatus Acidoferrales bacterium]
PPTWPLLPLIATQTFAASAACLPVHAARTTAIATALSAILEQHRLFRIIQILLKGCSSGTQPYHAEFEISMPRRGAHLLAQ